MKQQSNNGLLVIKASAGSGKTYTLAKLYIEQLLFRANGSERLVLRHQPDYHRHILAITFTNKATDEMKNRIVKELFILSQDIKESEYYDYFAERCTDEALNGMQQAAHDALVSILFNYSDFTVSTIDSFFQSILRNFARELDRDYNYEIQVDADFAVAAAVHSFLLSLGRDINRAGKPRSTTIEQWVTDLIRNKVERSENWNFYNGSDLTEIAHNIEQELFSSRMKELRKYLSKKNDDGTVVTDLKKIQSFQQMLIKACNFYQERFKNGYTGKMHDIMTRHGITEDNLDKRQPLYTFLLADKMQEDNAKPSDILRRLSAENIDSQFKGKFTLSLNATDEIIQLVHEVTSAYDLWQLTDKIAKQVGTLGLIGAIDEKIEEYRKDSNTILIADTNQLIGEIIGDNPKDSVPFIYERAGSWINHYMIDEFQDTSLKQYENFKPLLYESLSHSDDNFNMLIGDAKQSIYRFRNADPAIFRDLIAYDFADKGLRQDSLPTNYRSLPTIIDFNNEIFARIINRYAPEGDNGTLANIVRRTYMPNGSDTDFKQKKDATEPEGFVRIIATDKEGNHLADNSQVLEMLPEYLLELHQRYDWKHIGILVNKKDEGTAIVTEILNYNITAPDDKKIRITSDESMLLKNSTAVRRVISMLRFIDLVQYKVDDDNIDDETEATPKASQVTTRQVLESKNNKRRLNDQRMYNALSEFIKLLANNEQHDAADTGRLLAKSLADTAHAQEMTANEIMSDYAQQLQHLLPDPHTNLLSLSSIVEHVIGCISDESTNLQTTFLMALQDCINAFETSSPGATVREFLRYWDQCKDKLTVASASTDDSIRIMTIHKSKGLEFECVILPFVNWSLTTNLDNTYWMPQEQWHLQKGIADVFNAVPDVSYDKDIVPPLIPLPKSAAVNAKTSCHFFEEYLDHQAADILIDNLNKTYVAFTRPKEELHMFTFTKKPDKKPKVNQNENTGQLVTRLAREMKGETPAQAMGAITSNIEWGSPRTIHKTIDDLKKEEKKKKKKKNQDAAVSQDMPPYFVTKAPANVKVKLPHDTTIAQDRGMRLHNLLSHIRYGNDVEKALQFAKRYGIFEEEGKWNITQIRHLLRQLITHPVTAEWWDDKNIVYTERSIVSTQNETKRPDRIVKRPDGTMIVIDFKFGRQLRKHHKQVAEYMDLLKHMRHPKVEGYIIYIIPDQELKVEAVNSNGVITYT